MPAIRSSVTPAHTELSFPASSRGPSTRPTTIPWSTTPAPHRATPTTDPSDELEGITIHGTIGGFRFQGVQVFLTYPQVGGLAVNQVEDFFRSLPNIKNWVLGKEYHEDGGKFPNYA